MSIFWCSVTKCIHDTNKVFFENFFDFSSLEFIKKGQAFCYFKLQFSYKKSHSVRKNYECF